MSRPLHKILRKQQCKMKVTSQMSALLMEFAKAGSPAKAHQLSASIIQAWLATSVSNKVKA